MNLGIKERLQERRIKSDIRLQAGIAADTVIDRHYNDKDPAFTLYAGVPPAGITPEEFADRVGTRAIAMLTEIMLRVPVEYDPVTSRLAALEFDPTNPEAERSPQPDEVIIVFAGKTALT